MSEQARVGVPRALLYHWFAPAWETFLTALGAVPIVSPPTNKTLLDLALRAALDEVCLPVKLFLGHAVHLSTECDLLFVPHLVSLERGAFTCPKFMGLPDLVRQALPGLRSLVATVDVKGGLTWEAAAREVAAGLGHHGAKVRGAWRSAWAAQMRHEASLRSEIAVGAIAGGKDGPILAVLGHPYCLYDSFLNMSLLERLAAAGCRAITPEMLSAEAIEEGLSNLPRELYWSFGRRQLGAAHHLLAVGACRGVIHATAFACGPEALVGELIAREVARRRIPFLHLHLDEHTGEAGLLTRLEAFLDMVGRWRR